MEVFPSFFGEVGAGGGSAGGSTRIDRATGMTDSILRRNLLVEANRGDPVPERHCSPPGRAGRGVGNLAKATGPCKSSAAGTSSRAAETTPGEAVTPTDARGREENLRGPEKTGQFSINKKKKKWQRNNKLSARLINLFIPRTRTSYAIKKIMLTITG